MTMLTDPRIARLITLIRGAVRPPARVGRIALALAFGAIRHTVFAAGVLAMIVALFFGLSESLGTLPWPWATLANAALIVQFPLAHSMLLTGRGGCFLARLIPGPHGATLATTTYAIIAAAQLLALFALWTPSGIVWWRAEGVAFGALTAAYAASWLILLKASFDAVVCVDVLEHVADLHKVMAEVARVLRPGGLFLFDTINRNPLALLATITVAEDLLRLLPRGTHDPAMFIKPHELRAAIQGAGPVPGAFTGLGPRGVNRRLDLTFGPLPLTAILCMGTARKPAVLKEGD